MGIFSIFRVGFRLIEHFGAMPFIIIGVAGFAISATMFGIAANDKHVFDVSPSCQAGFALRQRLDGACHLEVDQVESAYRSRWMRGVYRNVHAVLVNVNGERFDVRIVRDGDDSSYPAVAGLEGQSTSVQYLGTTPVAIETTSGMYATSNYPDADRIKTWLFAAIAMAIVGIIAALAWRPGAVYGMNGQPIRQVRR